MKNIVLTIHLHPLHKFARKTLVTNTENSIFLMQQKPLDKTYSEKEAARRRDKALQRALSMPPKPHKQESNGGDDKSTACPR